MLGTAHKVTPNEEIRPIQIYLYTYMHIYISTHICICIYMYMCMYMNKSHWEMEKRWTPPHSTLFCFPRRKIKSLKPLRPFTLGEGNQPRPKGRHTARRCAAGSPPEKSGAMGRGAASGNPLLQGRTQKGDFGFCLGFPTQKRVVYLGVP